MADERRRCGFDFGGVDVPVRIEAHVMRCIESVRHDRETSSSPARQQIAFEVEYAHPPARLGRVGRVPGEDACMKSKFEDIGVALG